jgi:type VII secretion protein EccE
MTGTTRPVARAAAPVAARRARPIAVPLRRDRQAAGRNVARLMVVQGALLALAAGAVLRGIWLAVAVCAVVVCAAVLLRRRGRWWTQHVGIVWRYRGRRRRAVPAGGDPRLLGLRRLAPGLAVADVGTAPNVAGVAVDGTGWFAVAEVEPAADVSTGEPQVPLDRLVRSVSEHDRAGITVQVVSHCAGVPGPEVDPSGPAATSYRQLQELCGFVPAMVQRWIAVHLDVTTVALSTVEDLDAELARAPEAVAALAHRLANALTRAGTPTRVLDAAEVAVALRVSCDLDAAGLADPGRAPSGTESWRNFRSDHLTHVSYWMSEWPPLAARNDVLHQLATVPAGLTSVAVTIRQHDGSADVRGLVRVAARQDEIRRVCARLTATAQAAGVRLFRLDGEQGPAVYATAPTGGAPR